jgi:hypothetical protein
MERIRHLREAMTAAIAALCLAGPAVQTARADSLFLKDGSVLQGRISQGPSGDYVVSNPRYGQVSVSQADVVYRQSEGPAVQVETFIVSLNGLSVVSSRRQEVPARMPDKETFNLLATGKVLSVLDPNGLAVPVQVQDLGQTSVISVAYNSLAAGAAFLTVTTEEQGMLRPLDSGLWSLQLHHIPAREETLRIIVSYPASFKCRQASPEPTVQATGLIVWERTLQRQQGFSPEIQFSL